MTHAPRSRSTSTATTMASAAGEHAARVARHLRDEEFVNLGVGLPTHVADCLPAGAVIHFHSENGMVGMGSSPEAEEADPQVINAAKKPVKELPQTAYFDAASSFAMIRGGHIDVAIVGALQVSELGHVANWSVPGSRVYGVGGAMDLLEGAKRVIVMMRHLTQDRQSKIVSECSLPLTSRRPASLVVTDMATFAVRAGGLHLIEIAPGFNLADIQDATAGSFFDSREDPTS